MMSPVRREEIPPLENPVVLGLVFEYCKFKELKACRQVSKVWRDSSLRVWRSSVRVVIEKDVGSRKRVSAFVDFVQNENSNHLETPFATSYALFEESPNFWALCGPSVTRLTLESIQFESLAAFRNAIYKSCPNMEDLTLDRIEVLGEGNAVVEEPTEFVEPMFGELWKLKSLHFKHFNTSWHSAEHVSSPPSWMELLSHFPCLETLKLTGQIPSWDGLFRSVSLIRERDAEKLKLKHIHTAGTWLKSTPIFRALQDPRIPLAGLSLRIWKLEDGPNLQKILRIHASSLRSLSLLGFGELDPTVCFSSHPKEQLDNLKELTLGHHQVFSSMAFLKFTPNLEKLVIPLGSFSMFATDLTKMANVAIKKCKELKIEHFEKANNPPGHLLEPLRHLKKWLPNLEKIHLDQLGNEEFALMCELWPDLVSLWLGNHSRVDDCGISGLDLADVERINAEGESGAWRPITVPRANITALKYLQSLYLGAWEVSQSGGMELGVCSVVCGIQQMPQLRHLHIDYHEILDQRSLWESLHDRYRYDLRG